MSSVYFFAAFQVLFSILALGGYVYLSISHPVIAYSSPEGIRVSSDPSRLNFNMQGFSLTAGKYCPFVPFNSTKAEYSMKQLVTTGANWVAIIVTQYQDTINSTEIYPLTEETPAIWSIQFTDQKEEVEAAIQMAHDLGLKVMLKPHVDIAIDYPNFLYWRGGIGSDTTYFPYADWFMSYKKFLYFYAEIAQNNNVEMFSIGTELDKLTDTNVTTQYWTEIITYIRTIINYSGKLTFAANNGFETKVSFWDQLDYIGVDAYYLAWEGITGKPTNLSVTLAEVVSEWQGYIEMWKNLTDTYNKSIILTEVGYCSTICKPWFNQLTEDDLKWQALQYDGLLTAMKGNDFIEGFFFWNWVTDPAYGGFHDQCMVVNYKPAMNVIREAFNTPFNPLKRPDYPPLCKCLV